MDRDYALMVNRLNMGSDGNRSFLLGAVGPCVLGLALVSGCSRRPETPAGYERAYVVFDVCLTEDQEARYHLRAFWRGREVELPVVFHMGTFVATELGGAPSRACGIEGCQVAPFDWRLKLRGHVIELHPQPPVVFTSYGLESKTVRDPRGEEVRVLYVRVRPTSPRATAYPSVSEAWLHKVLRSARIIDLSDE
jgi:hypothetical protein